MTAPADAALAIVANTAMGGGGGLAAGPVEVRPLGSDRFVGVSNQPNFVGTLFGGQAVGQALAAAIETTDGRSAHSLHCYFLRAGQVERPVVYSVARLRDGQTIATRRVTAEQGGKAIFEMLCSFHDPEPGFAHAATMPFDLPQPEDLQSLRDFAEANEDRLPAASLVNFRSDFPVEIRLIDPDDYFFARLAVPRRRFWIRVKDGGLRRSPEADQCLLAFASDFWFGGVGATAHRHPSNDDSLLIASIDHALWFHASADPTQWLLFDTDSPAAGEGLGLGRGALFDRSGRLVASAAQQCLFRARGDA